MKVLIADQKLVTEIYPMEEAIPTMRRALTMLAGSAPARTSPDEVTLFKSLGIAIEDLASAHRVYEICKQREPGTWVDIGGLHFGKAVEG